MDNGQPHDFYEGPYNQSQARIRDLEYELRRAEHEAERWRKKYLEVVEMYNNLVKSSAK